MSRFWKQSLKNSLLTGIVLLGLSGATAWACGPAYRATAAEQRAIVADSEANGSSDTAVDAAATPAIDASADNATIDPTADQLPAGAKRAIHLAASKSGRSDYSEQTEEVAPATSDAAAVQPVALRQTTARPSTAGAALSFNDRMAQVFSIEQNLNGQNTRLQTKLAELARWDSAAQEKFRRAFGTVDDSARQHVAQAIAQQILKNRQTLAALGDGVNLEFYIQSKQK